MMEESYKVTQASGRGKTAKFLRQKCPRKDKMATVPGARGREAGEVGEVVGGKPF